jgi:hypothetical protein
LVQPIDGVVRIESSPREKERCSPLNLMPNCQSQSGFVTEDAARPSGVVADQACRGQSE